MWSINRRASRSEYWWYVLAIAAFTFMLSIVTRAVHAHPLEQLAGLAELALWLLSLKVAACRYHDIGRSGWWLVLQVVLSVGAAFALVLAAAGAFLFLYTGASNHHLAHAAFAAGVVGGGVLLLTSTWMIIWLVLPGQPGPNRWSQTPEPH